jgi:hypothetical protein
MPNLPRLSGREVIRALEKLGFIVSPPTRQSRHLGVLVEDFLAARR